MSDHELCHDSITRLCEKYRELKKENDELQEEVVMLTIQVSVLKDELLKEPTTLAEGLDWVADKPEEFSMD